MLALLLALAPHPASARTCGGHGPPVEVAAPAALSVHESSGLAASRVRPGVLYTHDDSGHAPVLHALTQDGEALGAHPMPRGWINDWEDLAAGPCPPEAGPRDCLYVGDIGDNLHKRDFVLIRVLVEPAAEVSAGAPLEMWATWRVRYPGGPRNAEALLVHPQTGAVTLLTKSLSGPTELFAVPRGMVESRDPTQLEAVGTLDVYGWSGDRLVTGADWDPDGDRVVVRTYGSLLIFDAPPCDPMSWWTTAPLVLDAPDELQGEAVTIGLDGHLYTTSEGHPMPLSRVDCLDPRPAPPCASAAPPLPARPPRRARLGPGLALATLVVLAGLVGGALTEALRRQSKKRSP